MHRLKSILQTIVILSVLLFASCLAFQQDVSKEKEPQTKVNVTKGTD